MLYGLFFLFFLVLSVCNVVLFLIIILLVIQCAESRKLLCGLVDVAACSQSPGSSYFVAHVW